MKKALLVLTFVLACLSNIFSQFSLTFPAYTIEGVLTKVPIDFEEDTLRAVQIGKSTYTVKENDGSFFIELRFYRGQGENFTSFGSLPSIIPSWWAVVPPLVAIIMALLIKEVLVALLMGIFIGAATLGFYADGFAGIFSGFLAVLDHYILSALNDPDHLSVVLFLYLLGLLLLLFRKTAA
jgi:hypothetical protein